MATSRTFAPDPRGDATWMTRALSLAIRGQGRVEPNPMVGCVIVRDGVCVGEGFHRRFGGDHAEVDALKSMSTRDDAEGATAYVTLEPCCHVGKTPPCSDALIAAKVARVVIAMRDPFPRVDGGGIKQLRDAGIRVDLDVCHESANELNAPYLKRLRTRRPWVIAKWAMSIDGRIATSTGDSQWITGDLSRGEVHRLRGRVDAIIVGAGTVSADNPTLTARPAGPRTATRIVLAGKHLPPLDSNLMTTLSAAPLMLVIDQDASSEAVERLKALGVECFLASGTSRSEIAKAVLVELGRRDMTNVLVEGGGEVLAAFSELDELDEIHAYIAPKLIGGRTAPGPVGGDGFAFLASTPRFTTVETARFDDDFRVILRRDRLAGA
jgi:diaminohydroxyphosphoribosylaminopyrimidine deaminase / 5-amino-6-(5-phosphoribosylamino)uracil reductase